MSEAGFRLLDVSVIHASELRKNYGDFAAVDGISFDVAPGESFGLLGPCLLYTSRCV